MLRLVLYGLFGLFLIGCTNNLSTQISKIYLPSINSWNHNYNLSFNNPLVQLYPPARKKEYDRQSRQYEKNRNQDERIRKLEKERKEEEKRVNKFLKNNDDNNILTGILICLVIIILILLFRKKNKRILKENINKSMNINH